ncbi:MAG: MFS transporter [Anaerolineales bacterium]|nr:MFS transporter [Anaerolineales bacterium]
MAGTPNSGGSIFRPFTAFQRNAKLLMLAVFLDGMAYAFVSLFFNFFILARGYDLGFLGTVNSIPAISVLALGIPLGRLADRIGYRTSMVLGIAAAYLSFLVVMFATSPAVLLGAMALQGAGSILYYLSVYPFLMRHSGAEERPLLFSSNVALQILAGAGGNLVAGQLPAWLKAAWNIAPGTAESYRIVLFVGLLWGLLALIPLLLLRNFPANSAPVEERKPDPTWEPGEKGRVFRMCLPHLLIGFGAALLIPYLNLFFRQRFSATDSMLGVIFSASAVITGMATMLAPRISRRLGSKIRAVIVTQTGSLAFLLILGFAPFFPAAVVAFFLRAGLMNMSVPLYSAFCMESSPEGKRGVISSLLQVAWQAGWAVGPMISGFVQARWGFAPLFLATGGFYLAAIAVHWRFLIPMEAKHSLSGMEEMQSR